MASQLLGDQPGLYDWLLGHGLKEPEVLMGNTRPLTHPIRDTHI